MKKIIIKYLIIAVMMIIICVMIIVPFIIKYNAPKVVSEITADGLLGYLGNSITAIPTIIVAIIAVWQTNKTNKLAEDANNNSLASEEIAKKANEIAENAMNLERHANEQTEKANLISQKLLDLEEMRQNLELRPSFTIINWRAPLKNFENLCINPKDFNIQVGKYSDGIAWGIELELLNTSTGFESIWFNEAYNTNRNIYWQNSMIGMSSRKLELKPLEQKKIYFYADKEFWEKTSHEMYTLDFFVHNRLDIAYREKFDLMIMSMNDTVPHEQNEVYLHLEIQNYNVGRIIKSDTNNPEGVIWEK